MKKEQALILLLILFCGFQCIVAQSSFRKLSRPEKCWVIFHPKKAKKALKITKEVQVVVDSIKKSGVIGTDNNGGKLDAFKHAYWMTSVALEIGNKQALKLGRAHEKGNYLQFKKNQFEDMVLPDSVSSEMDLRNNEAGVNSIGRCHFPITPKELQEHILMLLKSDELYIIKKDEDGNFLTCKDETIIDLTKWKGKWGNPKCLVRFTYH